MSSQSSSNKSRSTSLRRGLSGLAVWGSILCICLAALAATYMLFVEAPPPKRIVIATGSKTGAYHNFAHRYAEELKKEGLALDVRETAGSVENLQLLEDAASGVSLAIVQSGVSKPEDRDKLLALGSLYREPLWVFYRGNPIERLSQLEGKRIGVGPEGSGTFAVAMQLLASNGLADNSGETSKATLVKEPVMAAAQSLRNGDLDAAFFVAAFEANYIQDLLKDSKVALLNFSQHEAYHRKFRFLSQVTLPVGLVDLGKNIPDRDIALMAPTAMLVARKDFHPALISLLLTIATRIHGKGDELSNPGEFPSASFTDFPVSEDAKQFYKSGPPVLQRMMPFWVASLVERGKVMLIPLIMLLMPLFRAAPPLMRWRTRRKIYRWYSALREIDQKLLAGMSSAEIGAERERLRVIEHQVAEVEVPLSYMEEFYHLRLHLKMLQEELAGLQEGKK